ncbi:hypothetical protein Tco_0357143 [Tanacetum coccineum]
MRCSTDESRCYGYTLDGQQRSRDVVIVYEMFNGGVEMTSLYIRFEMLSLYMRCSTEELRCYGYTFGGQRRSRDAVVVYEMFNGGVEMISLYIRCSSDESRCTQFLTKRKDSIRLARLTPQLHESAGGLPSLKLSLHSCSLPGSTNAMGIETSIALVLPAREHECDISFVLGRPPALSEVHHQNRVKYSSFIVNLQRKLNLSWQNPLSVNGTTYAVFQIQLEDDAPFLLEASGIVGLTAGSFDMGNDCLIHLSWAHVHSKCPEDVQLTITMFEGTSIERNIDVLTQVCCEAALRKEFKDWMLACEAILKSQLE